MEEDISEVVKDEKCWLLNGFGNEESECEHKCDCISNSFFFFFFEGDDFLLRSLLFASTLLCYAMILSLFPVSWIDKSRVEINQPPHLACYLFPSQINSLFLLGFGPN